MSSTHVYTEIKSYLQGALTPTPVLDWDQIEPALEQQQSTFVVLDELAGDEYLSAFGDPAGLCMRETGSFAIHCYAPAPEASAAARSFAEQVQGLLRLRRLNGVRIIDAAPPEQRGLNDGLWSTYTVMLDIEMDRHIARP